MNLKYFLTVLLTSALSLFIGTTAVSAENGDGLTKTNFSAYVTEQGEISLPQDFRRNMVHLGSWFVPEGDAGGFHDVYADPAAVDGYRKAGKFPEGSVIVKELRFATKESLTTGKNVSHANQNIKQWFVMIKDSQGRFANNPNWGEGWGWALFKPNAPQKNLSANYQNDCRGCHTPAQSSDWIYVDGYPTLKSSAKH